jgi:hypothetical protein
METQDKQVATGGYDYQDAFHCGIAVVGKNGKFGYITQKGVQITPLKYDEAVQFDWTFDDNSGLGRVRIGEKWGRVNSEGKEATPLIYDEIYGQRDPIIKLNGKYGFISTKTGEAITPVKYDAAKEWTHKSFTSGDDFHSGYLAEVQLDGKWGCIDTRGNEIIPLKYDELNIHGSDWFPARIGSKWGFIGDHGELIPFEYDDVKSFYNNRACVVKNGKYGFINEEGEIVIPLIYDECEPSFPYRHRAEADAFIYMKRNGKYGYIDINGKEIIPPIYEHACSFNRNNEMAAIVVDSKAGFINAAGSEVIACQYEPDFSNSYNYVFEDDFANVKLNGKWGVIDTNNRVAVPFQYDEPMEDILEIFSVEELEHLAINGKFEKIKNILQKRRCKLNREFQWTPENIEKLLELDSKLIACFKKMKTEAVSIFEMQQRRIDNKDAFLHDFNLDMKVTPFILVPDAEEGKLVEPEDGIYQVLMENLPDVLLSATMFSIDSFSGLYLDKSLNWNECDGLSHGELSEYYISYAIHDLYDHTMLSIPDILKINQLWAEVTVCHQHFVDLF